MARGKVDPAKRYRTDSVAEIAAFAGVSRSTIYDWGKLPGYPIDPKNGAVVLWDLALWFTNRARGEGEDDEEEPEQADGLARFRRYRAAMARLDYLQQRGRLVPRDEVHTVLADLAGLIRSAGDRLQRQCGTDAYQILDDTLTDFRARMERYFDEGTSGEPAADNDSEGDSAE
jgi:hypothetical protein